MIDDIVKPIPSFPYWPQAGPLYICFLFLGYFGLVGFSLFPPFGQPLISLYPWITTFAIIKYHLFENDILNVTRIEAGRMEII